MINAYVEALTIIGKARRGEKFEGSSIRAPGNMPRERTSTKFWEAPKNDPDLKNYGNLREQYIDNAKFGAVLSGKTRADVSPGISNEAAKDTIKTFRSDHKPWTAAAEALNQKDKGFLGTGLGAKQKPTKWAGPGRGLKRMERRGRNKRSGLGG